MKGRVLIEGEAAGPLLRLAAPLSFWGGVDPETGRITDASHPQCGMAIGGTVLALPATRGSSSSSSIMLELLSRGIAPAALILGEADAILTLGVVVGKEMGYGAIPVIELAAEAQRALPSGMVSVARDGVIS